MRYVLLLSIFAFFGCASLSSQYPPDTGDLYQNQVHQLTVIKRFAYTPHIIRQMSRTPGILKPTDSDFYSIETDLNADGRPDVIGLIDHRLFKDAGGHILYILIKNDYDYTQIEPNLHVSSLKVNVLNTITNGFKDLSAGGKIYRYNGNYYE